jgi:azurin
MTFRITLLAASCVLLLGACSKQEPAEETATPAAPATTAPAAAPPVPSTAVAPAPTTTPPASSTAAAPAPATAAAGSEKPPAVVKDCATTIEATDAMQYNVGSITIPASCKKFAITLKHTGTMPATAMGHNVVIAKESDVPGITTDGIAAGASADYVKAGDTRVVAHTKVVGGGQTATLSFDPTKIKADGPYEFFCSFPGHVSMMHGTISVG